MKQSPRIVILGHVCIDQNESERARYTSWGSSALYMADYWQTQHHNIRPAVITRYGQDFAPYAKDFLLLPSSPQEPRTQLNGNEPHGEGRVFRTYHSEFSGPPELDEAAMRVLRNADIVVLATLLANYPASFVRQALACAPPTALKVLGTAQGYLRRVAADGVVVPADFAEAAAILPLFDAVIFSTEDHPKAADMAKGWSQAHPHLSVVLTAGPAGASLWQKGHQTIIPTTPVPPADIIDSVGCGDVFGAAFIHQLYRDRKNVSAAIQFAHQAARQKLFRSGHQKRPTSRG